MNRAAACWEGDTTPAARVLQLAGVFQSPLPPIQETVAAES